jgi:hypothetical protein
VNDVKLEALVSNLDGGFLQWSLGTGGYFSEKRESGLPLLQARIKDAVYTLILKLRMDYVQHPMGLT